MKAPDTGAGASPPGGAAELVESVLGPQPDDLQALLDSVPAFIWYKDRNNRILRVNRLAAESMGMRVEEIEGRSTYDLYPDEAAQYHEADLEVIVSGQPKLGIVETMRTASGEKYWLRTDKIPYRNPQGEVVGLIVFAVDISERVSTDEALRRTHEELERRVDERTRQLAAAVDILNAEMTERQRAEQRLHEQQAELAHVLRLHTLESMAANLAHEINQPLSAIVNFASGLGRWLEAGELDVETARQVVDRISREALRAAEVVRRLRASVRKEEPRRERCDVRPVLGAAASLITAEAKAAGVALHLDLDASLPDVEIDRIQIEQVVLNLLRNALEAVSEGARGTHAIHLEAVAMADGGCEVRVRDDGPGLPGGDLTKLLEPFFTTKPQGLGMGLPISRRIVEAHGGSLRGFTNADGGATLAFTLPAPRPRASAG
jgi:PAS domain S-box-containing protein